MRIVDTTSGHRAITLKSKEKLTSQRIIAALVAKGHTRAYAAEFAAHLLDALEESTV